MKLKQFIPELYSLTFGPDHLLLVIVRTRTGSYAPQVHSSSQPKENDLDPSNSAQYSKEQLLDLFDQVNFLVTHDHHVLLPNGNRVSVPHFIKAYVDEASS